MNIKELGKMLKDGTAALIISEVNRLYFTEFASTDGFLIVTNKGAKFITDSRYIEAAEKEAKECKVELQKSGKEFADQLVKAIKELGGKTVWIETSRLSVSDAKAYEKLLAEGKLRLVLNDKLDSAINELRKAKSEDEKAKLQKAQRIAEKAFKAILPMIKPGVKEREIAAALDFEMRKAGATAVSFETIVVTGKNSSKPHGVPGDTKVRKGDFVTIDFGALYAGYHSDTTRTVAVGEVTPKMANVYDTVLRAQKAGVAALKPGLRAFDADKVCRDIIKAAGYGEYFGHGTGHGVGVEIHELPNLSPRAKKSILLQPGNVVTVEPGIYLPGEFGVRIEDMLLITEDGAHNFATLPKKLIVL
ncbi:MAG: aminopeptidase P family protein [Clostridia bacterium]|nr:aminopeptidase P family protein [Clostridia bacterium]MBR6479282.1 aminopeptidase P family protein [Clostridia bacterium]MBR6511893.1 aminopeptidase P family protein [Clostridia bacterium]